LPNEGTKSIPRDLCRIDISAVFSDCINPLVNTVDSATLITLIKFIDFRPANRGVTKALLHYSIEPRNYKVKTRSLNWGLV